MSIHINLSEDEAKYEKQILSGYQINLIKVQKRFENYTKLRKKELALKISIEVKLKQLTQIQKNFEALIPKIELKSENPQETNSLEQELKEIQARLKNATN